MHTQRGARSYKRHDHADGKRKLLSESRSTRGANLQTGLPTHTCLIEAYLVAHFHQGAVHAQPRQLGMPQTMHAADATPAFQPARESPRRAHRLGRRQSRIGPRHGGRRREARRAQHRGARSVPVGEARVHMQAREQHRQSEHALL